MVVVMAMVYGAVMIQQCRNKIGAGVDHQVDNGSKETESVIRHLWQSRDRGGVGKVSTIRFTV